MQKNQDNRAKAISFTVALHVALAAALILGIEFSDYRPLSGPKVDIVEAEVILPPSTSKPRVDPEIERRKQEKEEEVRRKAVEEQQLHEQQEQAEILRKQAETAARKEKTEAEAKRKTELEAKRKTELAAKKKAEEAARLRKAEEEAKRKSEAEQQARENALREAMAQEQRERELNPLKDAYRAAISQQIARNWLKPPGISDDLKCEVQASQLPDGSITGAQITKSSGNATFDESVIRAIYKASPLPQAPNAEVFDRDLKISFCSTGNLC